ncbi:MAG TPA: hypothetical protein VIT92_05865 [Burkholderiaceae bacterium]
MRKSTYRRTAAQTQSGMMLIEGMLSILIFSFGLLAIVGLQAANVRNTTEAKYRIDASFLANQTIGTLWGDRANLASHEVTSETVTTLPNGTRSIDVNGNTVTVTVTWRYPGDPVVRTYSAVTQING